MMAFKTLIALASVANAQYTENCEDEGFAYTTKKGKNKDCSWVAKKSNRCRRSGMVSAKAACAASCETGMGADDGAWRDADTNNDCYWVSKNTDERCKNSRLGFADGWFGCKESCNACHEQRCQIQFAMPETDFRNSCPAIDVGIGVDVSYVQVTSTSLAICNDADCTACQVIGEPELLFQLGGIPNAIDNCQPDPAGLGGAYWMMSAQSDGSMKYQLYTDDECQIAASNNMGILTQDQCGGDDVTASNCLFNPTCFCAAWTLAGLDTSTCC